MKRDDLFAGYEQGKVDMLAKCIATLEELADWLEANDQCDTRVMDKDAAIAALRALLDGAE